MSEKNIIIDKLRNSVVDGDRAMTELATKEAIASGMDHLIIMETLKEGADIVGKRFEKLEAFLSDLVTTGDALKAGIAVLTDTMKGTGTLLKAPGKIVVGTISGDIHDIGKNLVIALLSVEGYEVKDLGVDVSVKEFIEKAEEFEASIIAMSALLSTSRPFMRDLINMLNVRSLRGKFKVMVGGAAVDEVYASDINADGYGRLASDAVNLVKKWL